MGTSPTEFARLATRYELPSQIIRQFGELHELEPVVARSVLDELAKLVGDPAHRTVSSSNGRVTHYDRVAAHFAKNGNRYLTKIEICEGAGLTYHALHGVLYSKTTRNAFQTHARHKGGRTAAFKLTKAAIEAVNGGVS